MARSKNSIRKEKRAAYHAAINAMAANNPSAADALQALKILKEHYFKNVDGSLATLDTENAEHAYIRSIRAGVDQNGWVTVTGPDGAQLQIKASLWDYIQARRDTDQNAALAAEYLAERSVAGLRPRETSKRHKL